MYISVPLKIPLASDRLTQLQQATLALKDHIGSAVLVVAPECRGDWHLLHQLSCSG
ncbi:hypothetical protein BQ8794_60317 [Mesorhizobium prunaredense]|uniref:Uncharacterized protein n=1 Tax=Mesorhizobium prunaredense TaxID=1631249 RepID=A0A1R3VIA7_9HYPH|nr:hypothetical protein BQ8794_60317 [Mesorhizobium prunaredense]